jgi:hypothetical protein
MSGEDSSGILFALRGRDARELSGKDGFRGIARIRRQIDQEQGIDGNTLS